ncbi:phosphatidylinositol phosphate synthase [Scrofimicrobium sp. R131]|uniref:Phosphatidylinositol phosphate synthase n=1 Tax=Scrofimicrobium appendicitidis TaxID=3079930 RepID=A0AAU7V596_9ACTO
MLGNHGRSITLAIFTPLAIGLEKLRITPNMVTVAGTVISCTLAVTLLASGHLAVGGLALGVVLFMDSVDGVLARRTGTSSNFGAFLDSTMDRITDGFVFGSLLYWAVVGLPDGAVRQVSIVAGIICMTAIGVVPYVRAKAESFNVVAKVGIAERTDRLIVALLGGALTQWGLADWWFAVGLVWVAFASCVTVGQRIWVVHRELRSA